MTVTGEFVFVDAKTGLDVPDGAEFNLTEDTGEMLGRIERKGKKPILTTTYYSEIAEECGAFLGPPGNVSGKFWLERKRDEQGRQRLLMWRSK